jgi:glutamine phosphoribosylpyrophosphate amidotransferase
VYGRARASKAIRIGEDQFCKACLTGQYPIEVPASMRREKNLLTETALK